MKNINNIIFDFGGVLYDIDFSKTIKAFEELSSQPELFSNMETKDFLEITSDYEKGNVSDCEFIDYLKNEFKISGTKEEIIAAWNKLLLNPFSDSLATIKILKKNYNILILSNTNNLHFQYFYPQTKEIFSTVDKYYLSHIIKYRKPDLDAFRYVLNDLNILPEETLFIDDSKKNILAAEKLGINTIHFINQNMSDLLHTIKLF